MDLVEVKETESFGKALFAKTDIDPGRLGFEVFREEALIIFPPHDRSLVPPWGLMINATCLVRLFALSETTRGCTRQSSFSLCRPGLRGCSAG
jgi:hypothetical protein